MGELMELFPNRADLLAQLDVLRARLAHCL